MGMKPRGKLRCSPWCGHGCTEAEWKAAKEAASKMCLALGPGWRSVVWENLGWHAKVVSDCGRLQVYQQLGVQRLPVKIYDAYLNEVGEIGGRWVAGGSTPEEAVSRVVKQAVEELTHLTALLNGLPLPKTIRSRSRCR